MRAKITILSNGKIFGKHNYFRLICVEFVIYKTIFAANFQS